MSEDINSTFVDKVGAAKMGLKALYQSEGRSLGDPLVQQRISVVDRFVEKLEAQTPPDEFARTMLLFANDVMVESDIEPSPQGLDLDPRQVRFVGTVVSLLGMGKRIYGKEYMDKVRDYMHSLREE